MGIKTFEQLINFGAGSQFSVSKATSAKPKTVSVNFMKTILIQIYALTLFLSCSQSNPKDIEQNKTQSIKENVKKWQFKDNQHLFILTIDTVFCGGTTRKYSPTVTSIDVYDVKDGKQIQTIVPDTFLLDKFLDSSIVFIVEDMNFDGVNDIRLINWLGTDLQKSYSFWFYNIQVQQFQFDTTLANFVNPYFDQSKKTFHTWWRTGFTNYGHALYKFENDKLQLITEEEENWDINPATPGTITLRQRSYGKIEEIEKKVKEPTIEYAHEKCSLDK
ncbi:MAG TPA: hypothetical protein VI731_01825 [Bacteroidia bacterium]|nr:hypothetical protein [Bacteroidia bacterium]